MKFLLALTVLLVISEFAPSALAAPVSDEEEAEAILQAIQSIINPAQNTVNQAISQPTSTANAPTTLPTIVPSRITSCFFFPHFKGCYYCANNSGQRIIMFFVKP